MKNFIKLLIVTILALCGFGGGCFFYLMFILFFKINNISTVAFVLSVFVPMIISWWISSKFSEKFF